MNQEKYVTRKKRIRQLEKKISELEHKIETLTELLDCVHQMLYTTRPRLARSMALEFERIHPDITTPVVKKEKRRLPNISIAPRADLVTERDSNGLGIGSRPQALLISQIYPITKFESLGRFKRRLGMAKDENSSGDKESMNTGSGSKLCRSQLYLWIFDMIAPVHARPNNEFGRKLGEFYDSRKAKFQDNPELWKKKAVARLQAQALRELKRSLSLNLLPMVSKELQPQLEATLNLTMQTVEMSMTANMASTDIAP